MLRRLALPLAGLTLVAASSAQLHASLYVTDLTFPVAMVQDPTLPNIQYVVQLNGLVRVIQSGVVMPNNFLDISGQVGASGEQGLLSLAFAPDYATTGHAYVYFGDASGNIQIKQFTRSLFSRSALDPNSEADVISISHQDSSAHYGGTLAFGSDGY